MKLPYDHTNPESIEQYGKLLIGKTLRDLLPDKIGMFDQKYPLSDKGRLGKIVEGEYFGIDPGNSHGVPDFSEAGVELKTTSVTERKNKYHGKRKGVFRAKERLSLSKITQPASECEKLEVCFGKSSGFNKIRLMMFIAYEYDSNKKTEDQFFRFAKMIKYEDFPDKVKNTMRKDWKIITDKVNSGHFADLSSSDTEILEASTSGKGHLKGNEVSERRLAYFQRFVNTGILDPYLNKIWPSPDIVDGVEAIKEKGFEKSIKDSFTPYFNLDEDVICEKLNIEFPSRSKNRLKIITDSIAGPHIKQISEDESGEIKLKTLRLDWDGNPPESWSFPHFTYIGEGNITGEIWDADDENAAYPEIKRLLTETQFAIPIWRQKEGLGRKGKLLGLERYRLEDIVFWRMPEQDIEKYVRPVWERTKWVIQNGEVDSKGFFEFTDSTFNSVCHIRPHGRDNKDLLPTLRNGNQRKNCFWLDKKYLMQQILP